MRRLSKQVLLSSLMALGFVGAVSTAVMPAHAVAAQGDLYSTGYGFYGQLGTGTSGSTTPSQVTGAGVVDAMSGGCYHSLSVKSDGTVWSWGYNGFGQLGLGHNSNVSVPAQVGGLTATDVAGGCYYSLALKADGTVWGWGNNSQNNLGLGGPASDTCLGFGGGGINCSKTPVQVHNLTNITKIAAGITFGMALKADGTVWAWGQGFGSTPVQMAGLSGMTDIAAGSYHALAVKNDGTVWTWGDDLFQVLGNGPVAGANYTPAQVAGLSGIVDVAGGGWHSLALKSDGTVWGWGRNSEGQVGSGATTSGGCSCLPSPTQTVGLANAAMLSASQVGSFALKTDSTISAWGYNVSGEFGDGTSGVVSATPVQNNNLANVTAISAGHYHLLASVQNNQPPAVDANGPYDVTEGGSVSLSATGSDPDGDSLAYAWDLDNNGSFETPGQTVSFSAAALAAPDSRTVRVQATDPGGLADTDTATVNVTYAFGGFEGPVDSPPVVNAVKAGRTVPVKFSLGGDNGLAVFAAGYPASQQIICGTSDPVDVIEETTDTNTSGLTYDPATGQYAYNWKTAKEWSGTCRQLILKFDDGATYRANFQFN